MNNPKNTLEAFKVIPETYPVYLQMETIPLPLADINNHVIVRDPKLPRGWGWFSEEDFHKWYSFVDGASKTGFTAVHRIPEVDD